MKIFRMTIGGIALIAGLFFAAVPAGALQENTARFFVVRHADRLGEQDALSDAGKRRAQSLAQLLSMIHIDAIYSTDTTRTRDTAAPTALDQEIETKLVEATSDPQKLKAFAGKVMKDHSGQTILIVGHSNTVLPIAYALCKGSKSCQQKLQKNACAVRELMDESIYDNLFLITHRGEHAPGAVPLRYGDRTPCP